MLSGIDPKYLNPNSRFGAAFYVGESPSTPLAEMAHHGVKPTHGIRFNVDASKAKVLDLTDPAVAKEWGYNGGPITSKTQQIGMDAKDQGYNVIRFGSERDPGGVNQAVLDNFNEILTPQIVTPVEP
ncbi:RES family NAD+ phosphorylase [Pseudomonas aestus]|nr:RES family NAD+ phosphorylase [Pseudomonas piscis]